MSRSKQTTTDTDNQTRRSPDTHPDNIGTTRHPHGSGFPIVLHDEDGDQHETLYTYQLIEYSPEAGTSHFLFAADVNNQSEPQERTVVLQHPKNLELVWKLNESQLCYESFSLMTGYNPDAELADNDGTVPLRGYKLDNLESIYG